MQLQLKAEHFFPVLDPSVPTELQSLRPTSAAFARFLWTSSGAPGRDGWPVSVWQRHMGRPDVVFFAVYLDEEPAGCFELSFQEDIATIGGPFLSEPFAGREEQAAVMTLAVERAFSLGVRIVQTTLDSLQRPPLWYLHQGFRPIDTGRLSQ